MLSPAFVISANYTVLLGSLEPSHVTECYGLELSLEQSVFRPQVRGFHLLNLKSACQKKVRPNSQGLGTVCHWNEITTLHLMYL